MMPPPLTQQQQQIQLLQQQMQRQQQLPTTGTTAQGQTRTQGTGLFAQGMHSSSSNKSRPHRRRFSSSRKWDHNINMYRPINWDNSSKDLGMVVPCNSHNNNNSKCNNNKGSSSSSKTTTTVRPGTTTVVPAFSITSDFDE